jgi:hypothetical protein
MDDLTNEILILLGEGKITKEAAIAALKLNPSGVIKIADGPTGAGMSVSDTAKMLALTMLMHKGFELGGSALDKMFSGTSRKRNDALFQKLMLEHPGLAGKDPARAKANFDYIVQASPHLLKHPLILGDNVANMTAMGATALDTLKTISDVEKGVAPKKPSEFAGTAAKDLAKAMFTTAPSKPSFDDMADTSANETAARAIGQLAGEDLAKMKAEEAGMDSSRLRFGKGGKKDKDKRVWEGANVL